MPTEYELIKAVLQQIGKEEPTPQEEPVPGPGMIYSPQEMERQRFEEYTGHDPKLSMMKNLYNAWRGNKILGAPIPGANPEVGTPGDALTGALMSAAPMAKIAGKTAGGGSVQKPAPAGRIRPGVKYRGPLNERVKGKVFRETDAGEAEAMLRGRDVGMDRYYSTSKNLALGQGKNQGIMIESNPRKLSGVVDRSKPASRMIEKTSGHGELRANADTAADLKSSIRRVTIDKTAKRDKLERQMTRNLLKKLIADGWERTNQGDSIVMKSPATKLAPAGTLAGRRIDTKGPAPTRVERAERDASRLLQNALKQVQDNVRKNPEGAFPTASSKAEFLQARVDPGKPGTKNFLAEVFNTPSFSEWAKQRKGETNVPLGKALNKVGQIKVDTKEIAKNSRSPEEFARELIGTLAHESGLHTRVGSHKYDEWAKPGLKRGGPSMADVPVNAVAAYAPEFSGQVQMDVVRNRMMQTPLVEALMKTAGVKGSPINDIYYGLKTSK